VGQLGPEWRTRFREFDDTPAAAASIGQVHRATWEDGREVAVKTLAAQDNALMPLEIAAGTYPNQSEPVATIGTAALLLTTSDLTRDEALQVVRAVYQTGQDLLAAGSAQGAQVNIANARRGLTVPLHDGAEEGLAALENAKPR